MSDMIGRFLNFDETLGRGLVKFVYYVLLFLLVVTTLYALVITFIAMFGAFWVNLYELLVAIPVRFIVSLLLLRVGAELVLAILSIDRNLSSDRGDAGEMSTGFRMQPTPTDQDARRGQSSPAERAGPLDRSEPARGSTIPVQKTSDPAHKPGEADGMPGEEQPS